MLSQASRTSLPPIFSASPIHLPPIRRPPTRPHVPFYKLPSHTIPLKWSLYRSLLRAAPDAQHREAIRGRWRKTRHRHCTSPRLTLRLLTFETRLLSDYKALLALNVDTLKPESMSGPTLRDDANVELGNNLDLPDEQVQAIDCQSNQHGAATAFTPYHELAGLSSESQKRLKKVHENLKAHYTSHAVSLQVGENYVGLASSTWHEPLFI